MASRASGFDHSWLRNVGTNSLNCAPKCAKVKYSVEPIKLQPSGTIADSFRFFDECIAAVHSRGDLIHSCSNKKDAVILVMLP